MFACENTPSGLSHPGTTQACTIQSERRMNMLCGYLSHSDFFTPTSGGNGIPILPLSNVMHRFVRRCQWSFGPVNPSGGFTANDPYISPVTRDVGEMPS